jgi:thioredoxin 1
MEDRKMALVITNENFQAEVINSALPVLVDFWADWCGPCRMVAPIIDEIAIETAGKIKVGKVNVDEQPELTRQFEIMTIPTIMVFKEGEITAKVSRFMDKDEILSMLEG